MLDLLIKILGETPSNFPSMSDKITYIIANYMYYFEFAFPLALAIIPLVIVFFRNKRGQKLTKKNIIIVIISCVALFCFGLLIPVLLDYIGAGFAVRRLYGS